MRKNILSIPMALPQVILVLILWSIFGTETSGAAPLTLDGEHGIIDSAGRRIRVKAPFTRVISLYGAHTENIYALGASRSLIGVSKSSRYPAPATQKPIFSHRDGPEKFLAARPDLILIRPMIDRAYPGLIGQLEKYGITVVSLQPVTTDEMYRYWQILGRLLERQPQAADMVSTFARKIEAISHITAALAPKKKVYFEAIHAKMKTFAPTAMAIFALGVGGGINVAKDAVSIRGTNIAFFGKEQILSMGERIDIYLAQNGRMNPSTIAQIRAEPGFSAIKAVREGKIFLIDEAIVSRPTLRLITGICQIGAILYPDIFPSTVPDICKE